MANATDVVGYSYDAALHCVKCAEDRFAPGPDDSPSDYTDREGNEVHPIFNGPDAAEECRCCNGDGDHEVEGPRCVITGYIDCGECDGSGTVSSCCDDCGEELVN